MTIRNTGAIINDNLRFHFISNAFSGFGRKKKLLDLGCGVKPFAKIYNSYAETSIGIDVSHSPHSLSSVDVIYDGKKIPFPDSEFDYVLCTEVMEHVAEPVEFLNEINRVLAPGGILIMTTPFMVPLHEEPYDFYRYTKHGIKYMLVKCGFSLIRITEFSGYIGVMMAMLVQPQLKIWNVLSKASGMKWISSVFNPFIFLFVVVPQYLYLALYHLRIFHKMFAPLHNNVRGYGFIAQKTTNPKEKQ